MSELTSVANATPCQACGHASIEGLQHCLHCGALKPNDSRSADNRSQTCPKCGRSDKDSISFCAFCGCKLSGPTDSTAPKQAYRWTKPAQRRRHSTTKKQNSKKASTVAKRLLVTMAIGAILATAAGTSNCLILLKPVEEHLSWQGHSVVVYAKPSGAQISLKLGATPVTSAQIQKNGKASFDGLSPGRYLLVVEAPGSRSAFGTITVNKDAPAIIGYPQPIELTSTKQ